MPLQYLNLGHVPVSDLSLLKDMTTLHTLVLDDTLVTDLSVLKGLPLKSLRIQSTRVSDLSPLQGMPLEELWLNPPPGPAGPDAKVLRSFKALKQINGRLAAEYWKAQQR
jgi:hypothetical protein